MGETKTRVDDPWQATTWEGSRREQLRRDLRLTLRERLEALEELSEMARHFEWMRKTEKFGKSADSIS